MSLLFLVVQTRFFCKIVLRTNKFIRTAIEKIQLYSLRHQILKFSISNEMRNFRVAFICTNNLKSLSENLRHTVWKVRMYGCYFNFVVYCMIHIHRYRLVLVSISLFWFVEFQAFRLLSIYSLSLYVYSVKCVCVRMRMCLVFQCTILLSAVVFVVYGPFQGNSHFFKCTKSSLFHLLLIFPQFFLCVCVSSFYGFLFFNIIVIVVFLFIRINAHTMARACAQCVICGIFSRSDETHIFYRHSIPHTVSTFSHLIFLGRKYKGIFYPRNFFDATFRFVCIGLFLPRSG